MRVPGAELVYVDNASGESSLIAAIDYFDDGNGPPNLPIYYTEDRAQAERWRSVVAAGGWPSDLPSPVIVRKDVDRLFAEWIRAGGVIPDF
jgi:hypothetical protein